MTTREPSLDDVLAHLQGSIEDLRLETGERHTLEALLEASRAGDETLRRVRNVAFDLVRTRLRGGLDPLALLGWLERVAKALDLARGPGNAVAAEAWFSPGDDCRDAVIRQLRLAKTDIRICVFTISDDRISEAVIDAHRRGIAIRILTDNDKRFDGGSDIDQLARAGIAVAEDRSPAHMHHKFAVFDDRVLLNGSFNWTRSASQANEENLLQIDLPAAVVPFAQRFDELWRRWA